MTDICKLADANGAEKCIRAWEIIVESLHEATDNMDMYTLALLKQTLNCHGFGYQLVKYFISRKLFCVCVCAKRKYDVNPVRLGPHTASNKIKGIAYQGEVLLNL